MLNLTHHVSQAAIGSIMSARDVAGEDRAHSTSLAGLNVLLVEDEMMVSMELEIALEDAEANIVGPVDRVSQGLALAMDGLVEIDVAILDVDLHGKDVFPVAEALAERKVPFLFHTGHGTRKELAKNFPNAPVCSEPMLVDQLLRTVASLTV